ncbi:MAG: alpha/beta fold hydrolase [Candidatus Kapaibacterium sp.]
MLLFLHGALYTKREFEPLMAALADQFTLDAIDFTGHGGEMMPAEPYSIRLFADDVLRWMERSGCATVDIFGFSMGGYVGLYLARHYPERVGRLMTLGTKLRWNIETSAREVKMLDPEKIEQKVPHFAEALKQRHGEDRWKRVLDKTA